jgi:hypothetical protein
MALAPLRAMVAAGRTSLALQTPRRSSDGSSAGSGSSSARMLWVWGLIAVMAVGMVLLLVVAVPVHTNSRLTHHILHHVCFTLLHPAAAARCCQMLPDAVCTRVFNAVFQNQTICDVWLCLFLSMLFTLPASSNPTS